MEKWKSASKKRSAFTIVELLTVMAVIAILIGLLVPALALVKDFAKEIEQKAQLHSIEVAIDMFAANSGYGTYPPSNDNSIPPQDPGDPTPYGGAQKLAEALVGQDVLGFHPRSGFRSDLMGYDTFGAPQQVYNPPTNIRANLEEREGPFIEGENANAYMLGDIYTNVGAFDPLNYVLCDVYSKKRTLAVNLTNKKTGMPILYYRARGEYFAQDYNMGQPPAATGIDDDIYYYRDNENLLMLGKPEDITVLHPIADGQNDWADFENMILNTEITTIKRPYRATSYILISAGKDGIYGTGDDITNFSKKE